MKGKFEINWNHYSTNRSKLIYVDNRVRRKALEYLELCLQQNFITSFTIINDIFNYFEDIFGNFYQKEYAKKNIQELKMRTGTFSNFYSGFIWLASNLEYTLKMLIKKFKYKLTPSLQD